MNKEISRRKFLIISGGTLLMLTLGGCIKQEQNEEIQDGISQGETGTDAGEVVENVALQPTDDLVVNEEITLEQNIETPTPVLQNPVENSPQPTAEQKDVKCPRGLINDPYPGRCRHYVDSNGSGYCDYSEGAG